MSGSRICSFCAFVCLQAAGGGIGLLAGAAAPMCWQANPRVPDSIGGRDGPMHTFSLEGAEALLQLTGEPPVIAAPCIAWSYQARLRSESIQVHRPVSDDDPASFCEFFESLAQDWQGWPETRGYESMDGTLSIAATHDRARAVRFEVRLRADGRTGFDWSVSQRLTVETGRLGAIAACAREFGTGAPHACRPQVT
jgi:hypothetical protein